MKSGQVRGKNAQVSRRRPRQERARETVRAILSAAAQLFAAEGYAGTTTNSIARRAGVSIGSLYQYFPNKDSILSALLERHHREVNDVVQRSAEVLADHGVPVEEGFRSLLTGILELHDADPDLVKALSDETVSRIHPGHGKGSDHGVMMERLLRERSDVRQGEYREMAAVVSHTIGKLTRWLVHDAPPDLDREKVVEEILLLLTKYLKS
jgi:AcrR family transcriptional regulator